MSENVPVALSKYTAAGWSSPAPSVPDRWKPDNPPAVP